MIVTNRQLLPIIRHIGPLRRQLLKLVAGLAEGLFGFVKAAGFSRRTDLPWDAALEASTACKLCRLEMTMRSSSGSWKSSSAEVEIRAAPYCFATFIAFAPVREATAEIEKT